MSTNAQKPSHSTIEFWCDRKTGALPKECIIVRGWFSPAMAEEADKHYRIESPDGVLWHVLSFDGVVDVDRARSAVRRAFAGFGKIIYTKELDP